MSGLGTGGAELCMAIPATLANIDEVETRLCALLTKAEAPIDRFAVRIILREALLNAVIHGSREDASQTVNVRAKLDGFGLTLTVRDSGEGFPWRELQGHMDVLGDSGRGLPIMGLYASRVSFNESGNEVTLYRSYAAEPTAALAVEGENQ